MTIDRIQIDYRAYDVIYVAPQREIQEPVADVVHGFRSVFEVSAFRFTER